MSIYHFSAQVISRSTGRSSVAAVAYRVGLDIIDDRTGLRHNFTKKTGIDSAVILAPDGAPAWMFDHEKLWNSIEEVEKRKDAQLAREINIALPIELSNDLKKEVLLAYVERTFVADGMVADVAFHDLDSPNPHAHIMLSTRSLNAEGWGPKNRDWNDKALLQNWRQDWATIANIALEQVGSEERIDHRSLRTQQDEAVENGDHIKAVELERIPQTHQGPKPGIDLKANLADATDTKKDAFELAKLYEEINTELHAKQQHQAVLDFEREKNKGYKETLEREQSRVNGELTALQNIEKNREAFRDKIGACETSLDSSIGVFSKQNQQVQRYKREHKIALFFGFGAEKLEWLRNERQEVQTRFEALTTEKLDAIKAKEALPTPQEVTASVAFWQNKLVLIEDGKGRVKAADDDLDNGITVDEREAMTLESMMQKRAERDAFLAAVPSTAQRMMDGQTQNTHKQKPRGRSL